MSRVGRWGAGAVLATVYGLFLLLLTRSSALGPEASVHSYVMALALIATPSALAAAILWRTWWVRTGTHLPVPDGPARLLATAVRLQRPQADGDLHLRPDATTGWRLACGEPAGADVAQGVGAPLAGGAFLILRWGRHRRLQRGQHHIPGGRVKEPLQVHHAVDGAPGGQVAVPPLPGHLVLVAVGVEQLP